MKPSEIALFSPKEQTLLVETEPARLAELDEDALGDLLVRVRRGRNKYSGLHRRQSAAAVDRAGKRYAATSSNTRTLRKAEIFEDALARVSQALSRAAKASAAELRRERLDAARRDAPTASPPRTPRETGAAATPASRSRQAVTPKRAASTTSAGAKRQARRDAR